MPIFLILSSGVFLDIKLAESFPERRCLGIRFDFAIVLVAKPSSDTVKKRGDRHPSFRTGLAPRPSGS